METPFLSAFRSVTGITMLPWDRFRNVEFISCPLVIHGTLDEVVPFRQGRQIFNQLPEPKEFLEVKGARYNNLGEVGGTRYRDALNQYLNSIGS